MINCWKKEWPKDPGLYWFYDRRFSKTSYEDLNKPELCFVEVAIDSQGNPMYITMGHFLYKAEGAMGVWSKAELPELPSHFDEVIDE